MAELWVCPEVLSFRWPLSESQRKELDPASTGWEGQLQAECSVCPKVMRSGEGVREIRKVRGNRAVQASV